MDQESANKRIIPKISLIGQVLLNKGLITQDQLKEALAVQKKEGGLLGDVLIQKQFVSEEQMCSALASQSDMCYIPIERYRFTKETLKLIPKETAVKYRCVPLEKIGNVVTMAMVNPFDMDTINKIEASIDCKIVSVIGARTQIEKIIKAHYQF